MSLSTTPASASTTAPGPGRRTAWAGVAVVLVAAAVGLTWAKWWPYVHKAGGLLDTRRWSGSVLFSTAGTAGSSPSWSGAWSYTWHYADAVWRAAVVALVVAALLDSLVPRGWVQRALARRTRTGQAVSGGLAALPSMMCTCCTAPLVVGLRRRGTPLTAALAYWWGNPMLNPAVLLFLGLVLPWPFVVTRAAVGLLLVVVAAPLLGRWLPAVAAAGTLDDDPSAARDLPLRFTRSLTRFAVVLIPEYLVAVFVTGLVSAWWSDFSALDRVLGGLGLAVVVLVGTLLVVPTAGEIPVVASLASVGGTAAAGALLVVLPALSIPSMLMVGRALSWRATAAAAGAVVVAGFVGAGLLVVLS